MFCIYDLSPVLKTTLNQYSKVLHKKPRFFYVLFPFLGVVWGYCWMYISLPWIAQEAVLLAFISQLYCILYADKHLHHTS